MPGHAMLRTMVTLLAVLASAYLALCALLFAGQRSMIYLPPPRGIGSGAPTITLPVDGAQLAVTTRQRQGPNAVLYFGGNAEDVSYSLPDLAEAFPEHALYLLHYRGYGASSGSPTEAALFSDAIALFDTVRAEHEHVIVVGRSLGSGIAVHLASVRPVSRLVLITPFHSIEDIAARQFPFVPMRWLLRDKYESRRYAAQVSAPTLLLVAEHDEIIPRASSEALHRSFRSGIATLEFVAGTTHNTISDSAEYLQLLRSSAGVSQQPEASAPSNGSAGSARPNRSK
jgi:pimeloyl-ACP methyl ester carboxylesterase